jgi:hypothetical protein
LNPPEDAEIRVHKSAADIRYLALFFCVPGEPTAGARPISPSLSLATMIGVMDPLPVIPQ